MGNSLFTSNLRAIAFAKPISLRCTEFGQKTLCFCPKSARIVHENIHSNSQVPIFRNPTLRCNPKSVLSAQARFFYVCRVTTARQHVFLRFERDCQLLQ